MIIYLWNIIPNPEQMSVEDFLVRWRTMLPANAKVRLTRNPGAKKKLQNAK